MDATATHTDTEADHLHGLRAHLEELGHIAAAATSPVALFNYVRRTFRERPLMAALAVGGFIALFASRRRRKA